ncbi:hypothetical protein PFBG_02324 [Plasmodium falciparum 7G8]|uniref:Rifin n=1 Tax=Plasmodium falciparum (isolate 7G8) TaxID=57266 RepID=W7FNQ2_PLAF8|nr:hypothetical protein PFBG_02324 [Plasmodium falciparum 7G8]
MKLHYPKILLFSIPLNILITSSSNAHNKNKLYITSHTPTTTSRVLSECDLYVSSYDNDPDMKSVKENFYRQTSQRFEEYNERINRKRQKCKEQCDKDIQKIIQKDKMEKSLEEKVEKGCLKCGCGLGGGVLPVWGLVSGLWYATWSQYVTQAPIQKGIETVISIIGGMPGINKLPGVPLTKIITSENYFSGNLIIKSIESKAVPLCSVKRTETLAFCDFIKNGNDLIKQVSNSAKSAATFGEQAASAEAANLAPKTLTLTNTIIVSFVAIVVIVLVMLIIYFILHYRRKKKMKKKQQYTKLLKE